MSIYGENTNYPTSQADLDINTAINYEFTDSLSHINKYFSPFDGAELDGISYALWMLPLSFELLEAWDHWEGLNHWNDQNIHDRFSKIGDWLAYEVMPDPQTQPCMFNTLNETYSDQYAALGMLLVLSVKYPEKAGVLQWVFNKTVGSISNLLHSAGGENYEQEINGTSFGFILPLIAGYSSIPSAIEPATKLPLSYYERWNGVVQVRTSQFWGDQNDVQFMISSEPSIHPQFQAYTHHHEHYDKNTISLSAYGDLYLRDYGYAYPDYSNRKLPTDHNVVLIDESGVPTGQATADHSTHGQILQYATSPTFDYIHGDATSAFNQSIWGVGQSVQYYPNSETVSEAYRYVAFSRARDGVPPYFVVADDIQRSDVSSHIYYWRFQSQKTRDLGISLPRVRLLGSTSSLDMWFAATSPVQYDDVSSPNPPEPAGMEESNSLLQSICDQPTTKQISTIQSVLNPYFQVVLVPLKSGISPPSYATTAITNGSVVSLTWDNYVDYSIFKYQNSTASGLNFSTDAKLALVRKATSGSIISFISGEGTMLTYNGQYLVNLFNKQGTIMQCGAEVDIEGSDVTSFYIYAPTATAVILNGQSVNFVRNGDYVQSADLVSIQSSVQQNWNMVSLPVIPLNFAKTAVWPTAISPAWSITSSGVLPTDPLLTGIGYWVDFSTQGTVTYFGSPISSKTIDVFQGWNMIGSISYPLANYKITTSSDVSILTPYWWYSPGSGYTQASTLQPGKAYWVKISVTGTGTLTMDVNSNAYNPPGNSPDPPPSPPGLISTDPNVLATNNQRKLVRGSGGRLYLTYNNGGNILVVISNDSGKTWSPSSTISTGLVNCSHPAITERNGSLYVVFQTDGSTYNVAYNYSTDSGGTWLSNPISLASGLTTPSPGPTPAIMAGKSNTNGFAIMAAYRTSSNITSQCSTTDPPTSGSWATYTVAGTNSSSKNPSLGYHSTGYPYFNIVWDNGGATKYDEFYTPDWVGPTDVTGWLAGPGIYTTINPSYAISQNGDKHTVTEGTQSGWGVIVHTKNLSQSVYTEFYYPYYSSYYKPVITGNSSGKASLLWYRNGNTIYKTSYNGGWSTPTSFGSNDFNPTVSIMNPPGGPAYAFWTEGTSTPYSIVTNSNGGPLQKASNPWSYKRRVSLVSLDGSTKASLELSVPVLVMPDGSQRSLAFVDVNDSSEYTPDNVWTNLQTIGFSLPSGFKQAAIVASRSITAEGLSTAIPLAFDVIDANTGSVVSEQVYQVPSTSTSNSTQDRMAFTFQAKAGEQLKLSIHPTNVLGSTYSVAIGHIYVENDTSTIAKNSIGEIAHRMKPEGYSLLPCYPNPFNPSTTIQYQLKDDGHVKLAIFNTLGQEVKTLIDESQPAGYKSYNLNAGSLSSGVYYIRLLVTDEFGKQLFMATQKLLLMK